LSAGNRDPDQSQVAGVSRFAVRNWLLSQQYRTTHPYTHAAPGGWSWTDLPGGVPDADDTPGAILAILNLRVPGVLPDDAEQAALRAAIIWLLDLQNRDGGWPTFCRGWGTLPFDRSSNDLTAHVLRAFERWQCEDGTSAPRSMVDRVCKAIQSGIVFLERQQDTDGTWLPLWFGHQSNEDDRNPLYGTSRVVRALSALGRGESMACRRAVAWLLENQNDDGGWSASRGLDSSTEETGLALESLAEFPAAAEACDRAAVWLSGRIFGGTITQPSPIGFYFARLWYFESLYPIIFAVAGLNRRAASRHATEPKS
jgi:squalene-hopene/tetraprenyl-beta-curcumene cyclase